MEGKIESFSRQISGRYLLPDGSDEKSREGHDDPLGHPPDGLDHHEVVVFDVGLAVVPHVGGEVGGHVAE